jgi:glyoxylase-like metal-dependent hydrolase (beta-lactamase superfamily II)
VLYEPEHGILVTGDLLFVGKVGGTPTEDDARVIWNSLQRVALLVPDSATVWPGHDYGARPSSTMGMEKRTNPFLLCADVDAFLELRGAWPAFKRRHGLK